MSDYDEEIELGATGANEGGSEEGENSDDDSSEDGDGDDEEGTTGGAGQPSPDETTVAKYQITGLVDTFDEQMNITGQLPIGSVQELPVVVGDKAVSDGRAVRVE